MPCPACTLGLTLECYSPTEDGTATCADETAPVEISEDEEVSRYDPDTGELLDEYVTDITSTGRKRAAKLYPFEEGMICEWASLKYAGGGVEPIIGCSGNPAVARHHGPDKDTLNNDYGNVHRICVHCHNRWHAKNDAYYGRRPESGGVAFVPILSGDNQRLYAHNRDERATIEDIANNEVYWLMNRPARAKD